MGHLLSGGGLVTWIGISLPIRQTLPGAIAPTIGVYDQAIGAALPMVSAPSQGIRVTVVWPPLTPARL